MTHVFLLTIIILLIYIAFFTPKKREQRRIRSVQKTFNTQLHPNASVFSNKDVRNNSHPDEIVKLGLTYVSRRKAMKIFSDTKKKFPDFDDEEIMKFAQLAALNK